MDMASAGMLSIRKRAAGRRIPAAAKGIATCVKLGALNIAEAQKPVQPVNKFLIFTGHAEMMPIGLISSVMTTA